MTAPEDEDLRLLRASAHGWVEDLNLLSAARSALDGAVPDTRALWRRLATELDVVGLTLPESHGGSGARLTEAAVVLEELAAVLAPLPYAAGLATAAALTTAADDQPVRALLPLIASGEVLAVPAFAEDLRATPAEPATTAVHTGGCWRLDGAKSPVVAGGIADRLLVSAQTDDGLGLFLVATDAEGLAHSPLDGFDASRQAVAVRFAGTPAHRVDGDAHATHDACTRVHRTALAVEQVAAARACLSETVDFLNVRRQFGRPLGSFQALKHRCADMYAEIELAAAASRFAVSSCDAELSTASRDADLAYGLSSLAYRYAAGESIQLHGGMGFTWECDAHLHLRRAFAAGSLYGPPDAAIERAAPDLSGAAL